MDQKVNVFLTVEHKEREFDSKVWLAKNLALKNFRVYLGSTEAILEMLNVAPSSILFHKSTLARSAEIKSKSHEIVFLDEESGPAIPKNELTQYCLWRYKDLESGNYNCIFLPNETYKTVLIDLFEIEHEKLVVSGWPRADMWQTSFARVYSDKSYEIIQQHSDFYLFVSSFGRVIDNDDVLPDSDPRFSRREAKRKVFHQYLSFLRRFSNLLESGEKLVIRPHPSESIRNWKRRVRELGNVEVIRDGDVAAWTLASKGTIQFGSTSTILSRLFEKQTVTLRIEGVPELTDNPLVELATTVVGPAQAYEVLRSENSFDSHRLDEVMKNEFSLSKSGSASEKIADRLAATYAIPSPPITISIFIHAKLWFLDTGSKVKVLMRKYGKNRGLQPVAEKISGGILASEVNYLLEKFLRIGSSENYSETPVTGFQVAPNLVHIESL